MKNKTFGKFLLDFVYNGTDAEFMYDSDSLEDVKDMCDKLLHQAEADGYDSVHDVSWIIYQELGSMQ